MKKSGFPRSALIPVQSRNTSGNYFPGTRRNIRFGLTCLIICLFFLPFHSQANDSGIHGYLKPYSYINTHSRDYVLTGTRFQLEAKGSPNDLFGYYVAMDFDYYSAIDANGKTTPSVLSVYPVEAYIDIFTPRMDIRIGQQFIFWGTTDWINPTDNINPWDYEHMSSEIEDYRVPVTAINAKCYMGPFTLQGVILPVFEPHQLPAPFDSVAYPSASLENTQFAGKITGYLGIMDFSLSYYKGFDHLFTIKNAAVMGPPDLYLSYLPVEIYGADWVTTWNRFGIKWEGAFTKTTDRKGDDIFVKNSNFKHVLGIDYIPSEKLTFNLQFVQEILSDYDQEIEQASITQMNMQDYLWASEKITNSISGLIKWKALKFADIQTVYVYNPDKKDSFTLGFINWQPADAVNFTIGGVFFSGPEKSTFGKMRDEDRLFIQLKLSF